MRKLLLAIVLLFGYVASANANACLWTGGSGTWDNSNTANWTSCGGTFPQPADTVTFDATSCAATCTITIASTINASNTIVSITSGACTNTCVLDFSVNNPSITMTSWSASGTGTREIKLGSGTFTLTGCVSNAWNATTVTGFTLTPGTSTLRLTCALANGATGFIGGGLTYNNLTIDFAAPLASRYVTIPDSGNTFNNLTVNNAQMFRMRGSGTTTITGTFTFTATSSNKAILTNDGNGVATISVAGANTLDWLGIQGITKSGAGSITCNNCQDYGANTNITINAPASGGVVGIIGGWLLKRDIHGNNDNTPAFLDRAA